MLTKRYRSGLGARLPCFILLAFLLSVEGGASSLNATEFLRAPKPVQSLYDLVVAGKTCRARESIQSIDCEYRVGRDLHFSVAGVGEIEAGVSFIHSIFEGDYYASFGIQHGCVIVRRGEKTLETALRNGIWDFAFVSPKNGRVYRDWRACQKGY